MKLNGALCKTWVDVLQSHVDVRSRMSEVSMLTLACTLAHSLYLIILPGSERLCGQTGLHWFCCLRHCDIDKMIKKKKTEDQTYLSFMSAFPANKQKHFIMFTLNKFQLSIYLFAAHVTPLIYFTIPLLRCSLCCCNNFISPQRLMKSDQNKCFFIYTAY